MSLKKISNPHLFPLPPSPLFLSNFFLFQFLQPFPPPEEKEKLNLTDAVEVAVTATNAHSENKGQNRR